MGEIMGHLCGLALLHCLGDVSLLLYGHYLSLPAVIDYGKNGTCTLFAANQTATCTLFNQYFTYTLFLENQTATYTLFQANQTVTYTLFLANQTSNMTLI